MLTYRRRLLFGLTTMTFVRTLMSPRHCNWVPRPLRCSTLRMHRALPMHLLAIVRTRRPLSMPRVFRLTSFTQNQLEAINAALDGTAAFVLVWHRVCMWDI
ncbi:hypothetical protein BDR06DRAFT_213849 [Suillus hirtellus]|nr:hypothetical protein BDR06DRAFT_213849 [Suillus hirtellus]